jgi:hypothetical protein
MGQVLFAVLFALIAFGPSVGLLAAAYLLARSGGRGFRIAALAVAALAVPYLALLQQWDANTCWDTGDPTCDTLNPLLTIDWLFSMGLALVLVAVVQLRRARRHRSH